MRAIAMKVILPTRWTNWTGDRTKRTEVKRPCFVHDLSKMFHASRERNLAFVVMTFGVGECGKDMKGKDRCDYRSNEE